MQGFDKIIGHEQIKQHLQLAIQENKLSHAYILNGEYGAGKKMLARAFAQTLQCEEGGINPCGKCRSCMQAKSENHPDIRWVTHEKASIGVDDVRNQVVSDMGIKPYVVYDIYGGQMAAYSEIYTGVGAHSWINGISAEEFVTYTYRLNNEEVEYLLVWKQSEFYQQNQEYFNRQEIVLETEACMLVHYIGDGWMPSQQE